MTKFCLQVHPHRSPRLDLVHLRSQCESLARDSTVVERFSWNEGFDGHAYINLTFATEQPEELWDMLQQTFFGESELGRYMQAGSIATCEGAHGWDDYLLLHHYDSGVRRDALLDKLSR